jgi:aspartate racemase
MKAVISALLLLIVIVPSVLFAQVHELPTAANMKVLGLVGGTSWHSTVEYYRYINQEVNDLYGINTNPPLVLYNLNQNEIYALQLSGRWDQITDILSEAAMKLRAAGAQAVMFCANTPHKVYADVSRRTGIPILHIADATGRAIQQAGLTKVGLIGTKYTMEDGFMQRWLREHYQVEVVVPTSAPVRTELHRIIQKELGMGVFKPEKKALCAGANRRAPKTRRAGNHFREHGDSVDHRSIGCADSCL